MRYNAHLTQSQDQVADLGKGITDLKTTTPASAGLWPSTLAVVDNEDVPEPNLSDVKNSANTTMAADVTYRSAFIDKVFSRKQVGGKTYFQRFFNDDGGKRVLAYELPTAGQMSDFLLRREFGVIDWHLGDMRPSDNDRTKNLYFLFSNTSPVRYVGGGSQPLPNEATWQGLNFRDKLTDIFKKLFTTDGDTSYGFNIHAKSFRGGSLVVTSEQAETGQFVNLSAGRTIISESTDLGIFKVTGGTALKQILLDDCNNNYPSGNKWPVGIAFRFSVSDSWDDYPRVDPASSYGFMDVSRYYLRFGNEHKIGSSMTYLNMDASGLPKFERLPAGHVRFPFFSSGSNTALSWSTNLYAILSNCRTSQAIYTGNNFIYFVMGTSTSDDGGIGFLPMNANPVTGIKQRLFSEKATGSLFIEDTALAHSKTRFKFFANPNSYSYGDLEFLVSNADNSTHGQSIWGEKFTIDGANHQVYFRNWRVRGEELIALGADCATTTPGLKSSARFFVSQKDDINGIGPFRIIVPTVAGTCNFLVGNPYDSQILQKGLTVMGDLVLGSKIFNVNQGRTSFSGKYTNKKEIQGFVNIGVPGSVIKAQDCREFVIRCKKDGLDTGKSVVIASSAEMYDEFIISKLKRISVLANISYNVWVVGVPHYVTTCCNIMIMNARGTGIYSLIILESGFYNTETRAWGHTGDGQSWTYKTTLPTTYGDYRAYIYFNDAGDLVLCNGCNSNFDTINIDIRLRSSDE